MEAQWTSGIRILERLHSASLASQLVPEIPFLSSSPQCGIPIPVAQAHGASLYPLSYPPSPQNIHSRGINLSTVRAPIGRLGREDFSRERGGRRGVQEMARAVVSPHWPALTSFTLDSSSAIVSVNNTGLFKTHSFKELPWCITSLETALDRRTLPANIRARTHSVRPCMAAFMRAVKPNMFRLSRSRPG